MMGYRLTKAAFSPMVIPWCALFAMCAVGWTPWSSLFQSALWWFALLGVKQTFLIWLVERRLDLQRRALLNAKFRADMEERTRRNDERHNGT